MGEFSAFIGLHRPTEIRLVTRAHVIAWRERLEHRALAPASIRRKLSALASLFDYLCEKNAVTHNPVKGVKRPMANANEGTAPALSNAQARALLEAPSAETLKGKRDHAILATLLYHGLRREELCRLRVRDIQSREGVVHFRVLGKREKIRFLPVNPKAQRLIEDYLAMAGHREALNGALFRPVKNNRTGSLERALDANSVYRNIVRHCVMRKMRWDCGRDGCFNDRKRVSLGLFDDCFPGRIGMTDVDAMVEVNARFLYGEWKSDFGDLPRGQAIMFERLTALGDDHAVLIINGDPASGDTKGFRWITGGRAHPWIHGDLEGLRKQIRRWVRWGTVR